ncbi:hypothetical protein DAPPUDRAFT_238704 [Daphnia pulex]|uniref:Uncharacterized protein n=1 Tax=Daphnia pulex TaxID=6669 RepID=E9G765_DAPPU|nr:hypothetical protein DAPPUDRAFT_238704 [Daphnia pulex]|eukprot:EFX84698.1 hypothetical protein DAPPUDRAFT_238704 [Daphnia pulex]
MATMDGSSAAVQTTIARGNQTSVFNNQQQPACWKGLIYTWKTTFYTLKRASAGGAQEH